MFLWSNLEQNNEWFFQSDHCMFSSGNRMCLKMPLYISKSWKLCLHSANIYKALIWYDYVQQWLKSLLGIWHPHPSIDNQHMRNTFSAYIIPFKTSNFISNLAILFLIKKGIDRRKASNLSRRITNILINLTI